MTKIQGMHFGNLRGRWKNRSGLTLFEIVIVIALIAILSAVYFLVANPGSQLAASRNSERTLHLQTIMNAIRQNVADQSNEQFLCSSGAIPATSTDMASASGSYNIAPCLIPTYLFSLPFDPVLPNAHYISNTNYDTGYSIFITTSTGQITLTAPAAELGKIISITR